MERATELLIKAVKYDNDGRRLEALSTYTEGINKLMIVAKGKYIHDYKLPKLLECETYETKDGNSRFTDEPDEAKKRHYHKKIQGFLERAEEVKRLQAEDLNKRKLVKQIYISDDGTGYSYESLFAKYLDSRVREIIVEEPYLGRAHQFYNLVMFLELCCHRCENLKAVKVITKVENAEEQKIAFSQMEKSLLTIKGTKLIIEISESLHDRSLM